jgi:hypothetical protein
VRVREERSLLTSARSPIMRIDLDIARKNLHLRRILCLVDASKLLAFVLDVLLEATAKVDSVSGREVEGEGGLVVDDVFGQLVDDSAGEEGEASEGF